jgi:hypothetical protein
VVFFDLTNQFNSVSQQEFFNVIQESFPKILPLTTLFYDTDSTVHHKWNKGSWRRLQMREGVTQGCPLSPLFASFIGAHLLAPIDKLLRDQAATCLAAGNQGDDSHGGISHLLSYVDDISTCMYLPDLEFFCNTLQLNGTSLGCFVNTSKTRIFTSCDGSSPIPAITSTNKLLGNSITNIISNFSTRPDPTHSLISIPVELTDYPPPCPSYDLDSPDVLRILLANTDLHLQVFEKWKLNHDNKCDPVIGSSISGDEVIGNLIHNSMTLIPFAIDPFGHLGSLLCTFLFGTTPTSPLTFPLSRPNATDTSQPSQAPKGFYHMQTTIGQLTNSTVFSIHIPHPLQRYRHSRTLVFVYPNH